MAAFRRTAIYHMLAVLLLGCLQVDLAHGGPDAFKAKYGSPLVRDSSAPLKKQMMQDTMATLKQASSYSKDSMYSPYATDVFKQLHNNAEHKNYLAASNSAPEAAERDDMALHRDVTADKSLHKMAAAGKAIDGPMHDHVHQMAVLLQTYGSAADVKGLQEDYPSPAAPKMAKVAKYEGDYARYPSGYQRQANQYPQYADQQPQQRYNSPRMNAQCNPCGPPPCPLPCPPPPPPPVPCVTEIPLCIQYLINLIVIMFGLGILKWYCSAMSELDRECGLDDRASGGKDSMGRSLGVKKSSFSPPMATISAYYDPQTNQVLLPHEHQHYQFTH
ncbi:unnamed protein product [Notodromas monacha]|uniref:Uncharacterized protein n=1 Tax=Notodromas monacha TaxID=399045 RepID=A0A7R9BE77_9CRUS|nr:unnamed protein product [Notodromas monacha]CAG0912826.1 unnamed protein product [Notodromas monacha]